MSGALSEAIKSRFPAEVLESHAFRGDETVVIKKEALAAVSAFLRDELHFDFLMDLTAVDYLPREPRFELVCHFYSSSKNYRLRLKCPVPAEGASVASLTPLWSGANWFERECWDMFGIKFEGHPDLRRLLMYDGFEGHPLRKDYPLQKRQPRMPHKD
jgi:NADH-quinone oxidoreductase subunit C